MIKPLRKYHLATWRILALILPVTFVIVLLLRPPIDATRHANGNIIIETRQSPDSHVMVTIDVLKPIEAPSCVVYANDLKIIIGTITTTGKYSFSAPARTTTITLFDKIHNVVLKTHAVETDQNK